ncbi:GTPase [Pseudactinotalea sp.]|uniref:GTPase n=1 Tax=Pseudactinotalea sp. TaxID=1926260 RepID=UPI003B3BBCEF
MRARHRADLSQRLDGLRQAVETLEALPASAVAAGQARDRAREVLANVGRRRELSAAHTVVALAGTTGSGKSSLLNALTDTELATVGARRPTTSHPSGVIWPGDGVEAHTVRPLLDWLEVDRRHEVTAGPGAWSEAASVSGLVLLDLPDIDSVDPEHRRRAERLAKTVDVLVWVLDPQKYADAVVHAEFLRPMARHAEVTVVLLNQIDRLAEADRAPVLADLKHRLADDGLRRARVLGVSARTGEGLDEVRRTIAELVRKRRAAEARLSADVATVADALDDAYHVDAVPQLPGSAERTLVTALSAAAGVDRVADAVGASFRYRARRRTGWPLVRWLGRFRADPLRRLHLDRSVATEEGQPVLTASSVPAPSPVQKAQVHTALRALGDAAAGDASEPWRSHIRAGATDVGAALPDELDQAVVRTELAGRRDPRWFGLIGVLQWLVFATFLTGALWLGVYALLGYLRIDAPWVPQIGPVPADPPLPAFPAIPWPTALLVGGAVLGILVALLSGLAARLGARRRAARTRAALRRSITATAQSSVLSPLASRVAHARAFAEGIALAQGK